MATSAPAREAVSLDARVNQIFADAFTGLGVAGGFVGALIQGFKRAAFLDSAIFAMAEVNIFCLYFLMKMAKRSSPPIPRGSRPGKSRSARLEGLTT